MMEMAQSFKRFKNNKTLSKREGFVLSTSGRNRTGTPSADGTGF